MSQEKESVNVDLEQAPAADAFAGTEKGSCDSAEAEKGGQVEVSLEEEAEAGAENGDLKQCNSEKPANGLPPSGPADGSEPEKATALTERLRSFFQEACTASSVQSHFAERKFAYAEAAVLVVAVITVWGLLTLPTIFYFAVDEVSGEC